MTEDDAAKDFSPGDFVLVRRLGKRAKIVALRGKNHFDVLVGNLSMKVRRDEVEAVKTGSSKKSYKKKSEGKKLKYGRAKLDLHGLRRKDAKAKVESELNRCVLKHIECLEVVHGKGSGAVRDAVHELLASSEVVANFKLDEHNPGVTWVYFYN